MNVSSIGAQTAAAPVEPAAPRPLTEDQQNLIQAVRAVNAAELLGYESELTFAFDRNSRDPLVRLVDRKTGEVVQQIPAEYVLRMAEEFKRS
jgi:uncharacterized FlaG/YvyC family protein